VSYARTDDQPPSGETEGWVTTLVKKLKNLLVQKLSCEEAYSLKIDYSLNGNAQVTSEIIDTIQQTAFLLVILSRDYLASDWCQRERNNFLRMIEKFVRDGSRVFIIELDRLEDKNLPPEFTEVLDYYDFYTVDSEEGHSRVLMPTIQQDMYRYNNLLTRLSRDLANKFQKQRRRQKHAALADKNIPSISDGGSTVFLAGVTDDLETTREEIKASLAKANIFVIPEICYFNEPEAFEKAVHDNLVRSDLFVQLLGAFPGKRPPGLSQGYVRRQYELAQEVRKRIMQWRSPELDLENIQDPDWYSFLRLETVRALALEDFVSEIIRKLDPPSSPKKGGNGDTKPHLVFVDADTNDSVLAYDICRTLTNFGAECVLPLQSNKPSETREAFEQYVVDCDAMMIVYGGVTPKWVSDQFLAVRRIEWQRERPFGAYAIYDGPPEQKSPVSVMSPRIDILQCRNRIDEQQLGNFIQTIQAG
jgi:hypothetical protein